MTVAEYVAHYLTARGVTHVFELAGGMICPLLDAVARFGHPRLVSMQHEQGAGFAAEGYARMHDGVVPGVAMATSGPGATNLLTAIGSCYFDSTPAVFITGQVRRDELKEKQFPRCRQLGFQELDICEVARPVTKRAVKVHDPNTIEDALDDAFARALGGRPGPVLLDIPFDVQRAETKVTRPELPPMDSLTAFVPAIDPADVERVLGALRSAHRPIVLVGGGAKGPALVPFLEWLGVPVVNSLLGTDVLPYDHPLHVGMIGTYGNRWANWALMQSDVLLVLGSRLDIRQTGSDVRTFTSRRIFHVDIDPEERRVPARRIRAFVQGFCESAMRHARWHSRGQRGEWRQAIIERERQCSDITELRPDPPAVNPNVFLYELSRASNQAAAFVVDVGQHQMWAAQSTALAYGQRFLTSGGMGAMGFALPAAIGAHYATGRPIVCVAGDGGFQINLQELAVIARAQLPIKMVVLNNGAHGMVRQFQDEVFEGRRISTVQESPDLARIVSAYGIAAMAIHHKYDIASALTWLWTCADLPAFLEVKIPREANAWPKTKYGKPLDDMEPTR